MKEKIYEDIVRYTKEIKLPATCRLFKDEIKDAEVSNKSYLEFLHSILEKEYELRRENGKKNRIRIANFPAKKYLEDLKVDCLPEDAAKRLANFRSLDFIRSGQNIILAGSPGTGNYRKFLLMERNKHISLF